MMQPAIFAERDSDWAHKQLRSEEEQLSSFAMDAKQSFAQAGSSSPASAILALARMSATAAIFIMRSPSKVESLDSERVSNGMATISKRTYEFEWYLWENPLQKKVNDQADMTPPVSGTSSVVIGLLGATKTRVYVKGARCSYFQVCVVIAVEKPIVLLHVPSLIIYAYSAVVVALPQLAARSSNKGDE